MAAPKALPGPCKWCELRRNNNMVIAWKCIRGHVGDKRVRR